RILQIIGSPLQNGVPYRIRVGAGSEEAERASGQLGLNIYGDHMPPVAGLMKKVRIEERVQGVLQDHGRTSVDGFPFQLEETAEAPQRFANIHGDVLSLTSALSPQRRDRDRPGGETNRGHGAKPMGAGNDRVPA